MLSFSGMQGRCSRSNQNARFNPGCIDHQFPTSKICSKTYHEQDREWPGLAPEITDILNRNHGFFKEITHKGMLKVLTGINKSCYKAKHPGGKPR